MGVSKNGGTPKWMVYNGWFGGTIIFGNTHMSSGFPKSWLLQTFPHNRTAPPDAALLPSASSDSTSKAGSGHQTAFIYVDMRQKWNMLCENNCAMVWIFTVLYDFL